MSIEDPFGENDWSAWTKLINKTKNKKSKEVKKLEELIEGQKFFKEDSFDSINRNKDLIKLHSNWLDVYVELQPFELKKKFFENKLKVKDLDSYGLRLKEFKTPDISVLPLPIIL